MLAAAMKNPMSMEINSPASQPSVPQGVGSMANSMANAELKSIAPIRNFADRMGIVLSALCVVHCLATPFVLVALPALEISEYHEYLHESLLFVLPAIAFLAFIPGFIRHRQSSVFAWAVPGLAMFSLGATVYHDEIVMQTVLSVIGGVLLIRAHQLNRRLCRCCEIGQA